MKAIIYHTNSKKRRSETVALSIEGDRYEIQPVNPQKCIVVQMVLYGYRTVFNKRIEYQNLDIDFHQYDEIVLISPVWAGRVNAVMRTFLLDHVFHDKKVTLIGCSDGVNKNYFQYYKTLIDESNTIVEKSTYIKGIKQKG